MHIFLLGATGKWMGNTINILTKRSLTTQQGPSGLVFLDEALKAGHEITIFARNPSKLPSNAFETPRIHIVQGEFTDLDKAKAALDHGAEILVSFAGPSVPNRGTPVTDFYRAFFPLLLTHGKIQRAMVTSTASYAAPEDRFSLKWWFGVLVIKWLAGSAYAEINGMGRATRDLLPVEQVPWTLFRLPVLTNGQVKPVQADYVGSGRDKMILSRSSMCIWILNEIEEGKWVGKAPAISNSGWI